MRYSLLPTLGALLSLGVSGVSAKVVCDTELNLRINSTSTALEAKDCIARACANRVAGHNVEEHCGPVIFAITHVDSSLPDVATCVGHFSSIVDQCIASGLANTGTVSDKQAIYEIYEGGGVDLQARGLDQYLDDDDLDFEDIVWEDDLEARSSEDDDEEEGLEEHGLEKRVRVPKKKAGTKVKTRKGTTRKGTTKKGATKTKTPNKKGTKAKTDAKKKKQQQQCQAPPKGKGKTGTKNPKTGAATKPKSGSTKVTRDDVESPQLFRRVSGSSRGSSSSGSSRGSSSGHSSSGSSSSSGAACALPDVSSFYKVQRLTSSSVTHYRFKTRTNWQNTITRERYPKQRNVMRDMKADGKFDVIEMRRAQVAIVGEANGKTDPHDVQDDEGRFLLCNGGFFIMGGATGMRLDVDGQSFDAARYDHWSVGRTSSTDRYLPIPPSQSQHYQKLEGADGSYLYSGPKLIRRLNLMSPELMYRDASGHSSAYTRIPGGVATANQPNERLVTAELADGRRYLFVYTAESRNKGMDLNEMRDLIKTFLSEFAGVANLGSQTRQLLNLDGGGSIYVSFVNGRQKYVIAGGNIGGATPARIPNPRKVTNMVKFHV